MPCIRDWIKLLFATILVEDTIVEFDGLIPVVLRRVGSKAVIASSASWVLGIALQVELWRKWLVDVVEVVEW